VQPRTRMRSRVRICRRYIYRRGGPRDQVLVRARLQLLRSGLLPAATQHTPQVTGRTSDNHARVLSGRVHVALQQVGSGASGHQELEAGDVDWVLLPD